MPRAEVVRVPARAVRRGPLAEIFEIPGEVLGLPVMVAGRRPRPVQVTAPGRRVAVAEVGGAAVRVGVVAGGEDGPLDRVEERRRRRARIERRSRRCRRRRRGPGRPTRRDRVPHGDVAIAWLEPLGAGPVPVARGVAAGPPADRLTRFENPNSRISVAQNAIAPSATVRAIERGPDGGGASLIGESLPRRLADGSDGPFEAVARRHSAAAGRSSRPRRPRSRRRAC